MSKTITSLSTLLLFLLFPLSLQECQVNTNNCKQCHPLTNLCVVCEKSIYKPDQEGGCEPSHQCKIGENYCNKCNNNGDFCLQCELGFYTDENGGCSTTDNCIISENGKCLKCKDDFYLIEGLDLNFCKYKFSDDIKNCAEINFYNGKCIKCQENFYMSSDDKRCININSCKKSALGICTNCNGGFYLDKTDNLCKTSNDKFKFCKISLDGKICSECSDGFFLSEDGFCATSANCAKVNENYDCIECSEGYFLCKTAKICTTEEHCESANFQFGICSFCEDSFYLEVETRKCFSSKEDEKFKFCSKVSSGNCIMCEPGYQLGKDNKCSLSRKCLESENGICIKCEEGYHLGLDNKCINIEKCIYSNERFECLECENNYYFDTIEKKCFPGINQYKNCKKSYLYDKYCEKCKDGFYLSTPDKMCYSNTEDNIFYKCVTSTDDGSGCSECIDNYFVGVKDLKCSKIEGCAISENENKCIECNEYLCLDVKKQTCESSFFAPDNEEQFIYINCNKTNEEGTECEICNNYSELINGICVDKVECAEEKDGECVKCNEKSYAYFYMCLNNFFGCVETFNPNCLRCDNKFDFDECTECMEGYELDENAKCVLKEDI